ncbi:MAG: radical SAM protein [Desulfovibrio sp.]|nr:radical SAM protein [Desulfovibrio sp.]
MRFLHPAPKVVKHRILPVFTPQAGCEGHCIFCAQHLQTGRPQANIQQAFDSMVRDLAKAQEGPPVELAFYGGTFTALPEKWILAFLEVAARYKHLDVVSAIRCSTRPDATDEALLKRLVSMGLDMVELGVQTFDEAVLKTACRGHTGQDTREACERIRAAGLRLGLQLLPSLPGHSTEAFGKDIAECVAIKPDMVRLHPCLVLAGTGLEPLYRVGVFAPWSLETTVKELAEAVLCLWRAGISVARIGLAFEPALEEAVLAGPRHPALGSMVRAQALLMEITSRLKGRQAKSLALPERLSGEFWGHAKELESVYETLGLSRDCVLFENREDLLLFVRHHE